MQLVTAVGTVPELTPDALFERVRRSVVTVTVRHDHRPVSSGSGAAIGSAGGTLAFVVTNRHVVSDPVPAGAGFEVEVRTADEARWDAVLDFVSERHDLAVLAVPSAAPTLPPLPLEPRSRLRVGQTVFAVGSPIGLRLTFTSGIVSAFRGPWIQTDATVHSGSSGGPLLTTTGHLCGIITQAHEQKDFAFALPADAVVEMLVERDESAGR
jgi:S1-C subfamily serine protease